MDDRFRLQRFVDTQNPVFAQVCAELRQGRKSGHWMWFIFPQLKGLGHSRMPCKSITPANMTPRRQSD